MNGLYVCTEIIIPDTLFWNKTNLIYISLAGEIFQWCSAEGGGTQFKQFVWWSISIRHQAGENMFGNCRKLKLEFWIKWDIWHELHPTSSSKTKTWHKMVGWEKEEKEEKFRASFYLMKAWGYGWCNPWTAFKTCSPNQLECS